MKSYKESNTYFLHISPFSYKVLRSYVCAFLSGSRPGLQGPATSDLAKLLFNIKVKCKWEKKRAGSTRDMSWAKLKKTHTKRQEVGEARRVYCCLLQALCIADASSPHKNPKKFRPCLALKPLLSSAVKRQTCQLLREDKIITFLLWCLNTGNNLKNIKTRMNKQQYLQPLTLKTREHSFPE